MMKCMDFQPRRGWENRRRSAREVEKEGKENRGDGIFVRKWHGFPGFGISIRNIGRRWLEREGGGSAKLGIPIGNKELSVTEQGYASLSVGLWERRTRDGGESDGRMEG